MPSPVTAASTDRRFVAGAVALIVLATVAAYSNSFGGPFILDDRAAITINPTVHHLWTAWSPPHGGGVTPEGRPLLNFTLALNYAISGPAVWSYHVLNVAIHLAAGLVLFGLVRRTLALAPWARLPGPADRTGFALVAALLWVLHPLQTESVTYVVQRAESLMGLCFLLTLYGLLRASQATKPLVWLALSFGCCLAGMATKEVMVVAPLVALLFDATFLAGNFRTAWSQRRAYYLALAATWILLAVLVAGAGNRGGTIGTKAGVEWWQFALTQTRGVIHYLALSFWPRPLIFDYGTDFIHSASEWVPYALLDAALLAATVFALRRRPALGFLAASFFLILAPSSSIVGGTRQMLAEHRMYLSLAAVVILALLGLCAALGRRGLWVGGLLAAVLGVATYARNYDYRSESAIWRDTGAKRPANAWAQNNLGMVYLIENRDADAEAQFRRALELKPDLAEAHNNLGSQLLAHGKPAEATEHFRIAVRLTPQDPDAHSNLANGLLYENDTAGAIEQYRAAIRLQPDNFIAHNNLGNTFARSGNVPEAVAQYREALRIDPANASVHNNWGNVLLPTGAVDDAIAHYQEALKLDPNYAEAHYNLANALETKGNRPEAKRHYEAALRLKPDYAGAHENLGSLLLQERDIAGAFQHYQAAVNAVPAEPIFHCNLGMVFASQGRFAEAARQLDEAIRLQPNFQQAIAMRAQVKAVSGL